MEQITMIADLSERGAGVAESTRRILDLFGPDYFNVIDYSKIYAHFPRIPLRRTIALWIFNHFKGKDLKGGNILSISPGIITDHNLLKLTKRSAVVVHDTYILHSQYPRDLGNWLAKRHILKDLKNLDDYSAVLAISDLTKKKLEESELARANKIKVINWTVVPNEFQPLPKQKKDKAIIGYINNFNWNKSEKLKAFINTFKSISDDRLEFHIYGKGFPFSDLIKDDPRIEYFGFLPEDKVVETLNSFDAYLSTSIVEGFGLPIMQAKACKVPVLCYDGEIPEEVKRNTLLWKDYNLEELIRNRAWEKVDVDEAYKDVEPYRPEAVKDSLTKTFQEIFV